MNGYKHARTTALNRALIIERTQSGWTQHAIAESLGVSRRMVCKWLARWRHEGQPGLHDRTSRPVRSPRKRAAACENAVVHLRRSFLMPAYGIAAWLKLAYSTVCRYLKRTASAASATSARRRSRGDTNAKPPVN